MKAYEHSDAGRSITAEARNGVVTIRVDAPGERAVSHHLTAGEFDDLVLSVYRGLGRTATTSSTGVAAGRITIDPAPAPS